MIEKISKLKNQAEKKKNQFLLIETPNKRSKTDCFSVYHKRRESNN